MHEDAVTQVRPDPEPVTAVDVNERDRWIEVKRAVQKARHRELRLPVDIGSVRFRENTTGVNRGVVWIGNDPRLRRVYLVVGHREAVAPAEAADANRC